MKNEIVTVFGGSGFLGRSVIQRLAQQGALVRVAVRNTDTANHLRVYGDVGQIMPIQVSLQNKASLEKVCKGAHSVINLIGIDHEQGRSTFESLHVNAPQAIAKACEKHNVQRLIHISALGADVKSTSTYLKTKALGEKKVLKAYAKATILRPSLIFGSGDKFFGRLAELATLSPIMTLFEKGRTKFQPIYVGDVADAVMSSLQQTKTQGKTFELGGEKTYTFKELVQLTLTTIERKKFLIALPNFMAKIMARIMQLLPNPLVTVDQLKMLKSDNVVSKGAKNLKDLGVTPTPLEGILPSYISCYKPCF